MRLVRRSVLMVITRIIRIVARPTATTVRAGSRTGSLLAQVPGMAGGIRITDGPTVATLTADLRDGGLRGVVLRGVVLMDMVGQFGAASKGPAPSEAFAVGSMEGPGAANN